ncbi:MAG TPA: hypothetical protein V6D08_10210 [Candidatus Obscuribacterales bacterium]
MSSTPTDQHGTIAQETTLTGPTAGEPAQEDPRPTFTIREAAALLGKSLRALERSLMGKWGNKLPEGWTARKIATGQGFEWRIIPPPGFRVRPISAEHGSPFKEGTGATGSEDGELVPQLPGRRYGPAWSLQDDGDEQSTIVIDRTDEVERLLREIVAIQKQLAEERKMHLEDLRLLNHLQGSMRLLEVKASETEKLKDELRAAQKEFLELKQEYMTVLSLPWWKRLFLRSYLRKCRQP